MKIKDFLFKQLQNTISLDLRSLAIFRISIALVLLVDLFQRFRDIRVFYTDQGVLPIQDVYRLTSIEQTFSIPYVKRRVLVPDSSFAIAAIFALGMLFGYRTTLMTLGSWILLVSVHNRNPEILNGGDVYLRVLLFLAIFLPLGGRFSYDYIFSKPIDRIKNSRIISLPALALILQIGFLYFFTALLKDHDIWQKDYTATYYALSLEQFTTGIGELFVKIPGLLKVLTFFVVRFELLVLPLLIFPVFNWFFRSIGGLGMIMLHIGFGSMLYVGLFPFVSIAAGFAVLPTEFWNFIYKYFPKRKVEKITISLDKDNWNHYYLKRFFNHFLFIKNVEYKQSKVFKIDEENNISALVKNSSWLFPIHKLFNNKILNRILFRGYKEIKSNNVVTKHHYSKIHYREGNLKFVLFNFIASVVILLTFVWNLQYHIEDVKLEDPFYSAFRFIRFDQKWNMFAPYPYRANGWYPVYATDTNGNYISLFGQHSGEYVENPIERPSNISGEFKTQRWRKYIMNLGLSINDNEKRHKSYADLYLKYLCRETQIEYGNIEKIEMYFMKEITVLPGQQVGEVSKVLVTEREC